MRSAVSFLTVVGGPSRPGPRTLDWFPPVGAALGLVLGGLWWLCERAWPPEVAAAIVVLADLGVTGLLHFDGLVDAADGLLPPMDRARRLKVMSAPDAGAFGVGAAGALLLLRWASLASIRPAILLVGGLWCLSRTGMALTARTRTYSRGGCGLAAAMQGRPFWPGLVAGVAGGAALCATWRVGAGLAAAGAALAGGALVVLLAERRIGGYTGDVLGAAALVAETTGLVVAAARW